MTFDRFKRVSLTNKTRVKDCNENPFWEAWTKIL